MSIRKIFLFCLLMVTGEFVFLLPFVVARIFRPTFLKVFQITNLELGTAFSVYGVVAMISYFIGGPLADRYPPRRLIAVSLLLTALGGVTMAKIPSIETLTLLYGIWGVSTILLFWAAYIKVIRVIGGVSDQGKAFGMVDAGRGFVAAVIASVSVIFFEAFLPSGIEVATQAELAHSLGSIILIFSAVIVLNGLIIWNLFPNVQADDDKHLPKLSLEGVIESSKNRGVWLQAIIILCAYVAYKTTDDFSLYASDVFGYNDVEAASVGTITFWVRPFAALAAGFLGDRESISKMITICFAIVVGGSLLIASGILSFGIAFFAILSIVVTSAGIYGLRGLYFALFQEAKIPLLYTGSAVGLVSVIGYTPDIFMGPLMGYILDTWSGVTGHQILFALLAGFSLIGLGASILFTQYQKKNLLAIIE